MLDRIGNDFQMLAENPPAGRQRPELGMKIRSFTVGNHVLFYEAFQNVSRSYGCCMVLAISRRRISTEGFALSAITQSHLRFYDGI
ncbi:type II toxin-antitoxin system RelE/ParE family toxin [Bradyrhizobium brasilense]|uniref:type II toxin-antitoxin system RelE/ParE family toxin n=1 Tax=Bradyrhizobium brasilense TaxID=1419277 RepID=UPI0024B15D1E|nr:type II toxin-antitoxin system RelE/ParE family toxin [Bradyrhizobium australafricanum]WFU31198.1 type II toxin-antitoxin system RelE/ParE family toxin [Bradyrhizobium australafricanum]